MNKRLENKITRWYSKRLSTRFWAAKHWHRWVTYGCAMCWTEHCDHSAKEKSINSPKGFAELAEYCYDNYRNNR
jgi:hypothetical protein